MNKSQTSEWSVVYKSAYNEDGSLYFKEKLTHEFLERAKRTMGSYIFANQYLNEIIPSDAQSFKKDWFRYWNKLPDIVHTFAFVDPAISEADSADFTGVVVVSVDVAQNWYLRYAARHKINPSQLINLLFRIYDQYQPQTIGIEEVAFQRAIVHFAHEEMKRRNKLIPITGVKYGSQQSKQMRILKLVPRFEWGTLFMQQGMNDFEMELLQFPRGAHDDLIDACAGIEQIVYYPIETRRRDHVPHQSSPEYEQWYRNNLTKGTQTDFDDE